MNKPALIVALALPVALAVSACRGDEATAKTAPAPATTAARGGPGAAASSARSIHALTVKRLDGSEASLGAWAGKVLLVVNTASECGYTPQYEGLQALHARYEARGFAVLGFPSNDFGGQEPGTSEEIATFCRTRFGVTFPMFEKVKTKGDGRAELYAVLGGAKGEPKWNFHKYLVDKRGEPVAAWPSAVKPDSPELEQAIEAALAAP